MKLIVSTCGTSLLTNLAGEQRTLVVRHANAKRQEDVPEPDRKALQKLIDQARTRMQQGSHAERSKLSAEYNGLACYYGSQFQANDIHWLIATDTWLGQATATIIAEVLGQSAQVKRIPDLQTQDLQAFRLAMASLVRLCAEEIRPMGCYVVFNLTGGFKSVQGFLQTLGMLHADETVYVFEGSHELLRLPRLPIHLDAEETVRNTLRIWRRLENQLPVSPAEAHGIPEIFLFALDDQVTLSEWGELVWQETRAKLLSERLWPSIDDTLRFGPAFERSTADCSPEERRQINERIGELARHLHHPDFNPRRLDFKQLAIPHQGSTHECDAWAQGSAKRLFGHFENGIFVLDRLAEGLH